MKILAFNFREHVPNDMKPYVMINATSGGKDPWKRLSPFFVGPVWGINGKAMNVENYWQFSKVYPEHWDDVNKVPTDEYFEWRKNGYNSPYAHRYPKGKGKIPVGSWIEGQGLVDYVTARKMLYIPAYTETLKGLPIYQTLMAFVKELWEKGENLAIWDYDVFNHEKKGLTLPSILNDPTKKYGHGFVLIDIIQSYIKNHLEQ